MSPPTPASVVTLCRFFSMPISASPSIHRYVLLQGSPLGHERSPWSLYEYVGGRPLIGIDPMGLTLLTQCEDHCAHLYPDWWQYHLYVGCINGCQRFKPTKCWWNCMVQTNKCDCTCAANVVSATCVTGFTHFQTPKPAGAGVLIVEAVVSITCGVSCS